MVGVMSGCVDDPQVEIEEREQVVEVSVNNRPVGQALWSARTQLWEDADRVLEVVPGERVVLTLEEGESFQVGQILVGQGPDGSFSGEIMGITPNERSLAAAGDVVTVELQPVSIEEVFDEFSITLRNQPVRARGPQPASGGGGSTVLIDDDSLRAEASASYQFDPAPDFDFELDLDFYFIIPTGIEEFRAVVTAGVTSQLEVALDIKEPFSGMIEEKSVKKIVMDPIGVSVGPFALTICPVMEILVGIDGSATGVGSIVLSASASAATRMGVDCPLDEDCDGLFEFPLDADVDLEPEITGGGATIRAYSRAELTLDILCSPTLATTKMGIEPYVEMNIEPRPSRVGSPRADCDGLMPQGNERVKYTVDVGADGKIGVDLGVYEDDFSFGVLSIELLNDCNTWTENPTELAPVDDVLAPIG
jgi:hypothetical protein